jgi:2-polyprenyl-3-methyl-5-hydroxy-6-metoxy-1,4-benzoquinol methylase
MPAAAFEHFSQTAATVRNRPHAWLKGREAASILKLMKPYLPGARILDLGAGDGYYARRFADAGASFVHGVDFCAQFVHQEMKWQIHHGDFEYETFDLTGFDWVCALGVLEFLDAPLQFLSRLAPNLQPGARLALLYPPCGWATQLYQRYHRRHGIALQSFTPEEIRAHLPGLKLRARRRLHPYAQLECYEH